MLLVSQSLFSVSHSHEGKSVVEPHDHNTRPHFHHHDIHDKSEDENPIIPSAGQIPEHDSDAIYIVDIQLLKDQQESKVAETDLCSILVLPYASATAEVSLRCSSLVPPPLLRPSCAIHLQLLSIRC